ncbi:MAG: hypothetical protein MUE60_11425, partial [Candidatus Eisenbacteria bacterium]|nr:hypothetical protein [Candidatus Eisenbacteria bacterium]
MFRQRIITTLLTVIVALVASGGVSFADMPHVVSYQGKVADGSYAMRFRIYDAVTGGTLLWDSGVQTVTVTAGVFSVLLGQSPQPVLGLAFDADYWLAVTFSGVDQTPRQRLASTGYAYMASGLVPGTRIRGAVPGGSSPAPEGYGAVLAAVNTRKSGSAIGIYGASSSSVGTGVYGEATATGGVGCGVVGWAYCLGGQFVSPSPLGIGVHGVAGALDGEPYGGLFESWAPSGRGVVGTSYATSGVASGVVGIGWSTGGRGVLGSVLATSGTTYGGRFHSMSSSG